jgi:hypothetical protein
MSYLDLIIDPLNKKWVQSRGNTTIGVNPSTAKNNIIFTLHLEDEECGSERLAPHGKFQGDDASCLHWVAPSTPLSIKLIFTSSSSSLLNFLKMEYDIKLKAAPLSTSILENGLPSM